MADMQEKMHEFELNRRSAGQWMTCGNPFYTEFVCRWVEERFDGIEHIMACEPYAGKLSLVKHLNDSLPSVASHMSWSAYDVAPQEIGNRDVDGIEITRCNTLFDIPDAPYDIIVTNPPYLASNSARRRRLDFPFDRSGIGIARPSDLYQFALDTCLASADVCVMLIPESFITSNYDKSRCDAIVSLRGDMFDDTDCPVCLALFGRERSNETTIVANDGTVIGELGEIRKASDDLIGNVMHDIRMNDPSGDVALFGVDSPSGATIRFDVGDAIPSEDVKQSSRSMTRMSCTDGTKIDGAVIEHANEILSEWRMMTSDVLMTPFKGVRKDGKYRRRLAFKEAQAILSKAIDDVGKATRQ